MYVVRSKRGKPVARFQTKREAEVFVRIRSAKSPSNPSNTRPFIMWREDVVREGRLTSAEQQTLKEPEWKKRLSLWWNTGETVKGAVDMLKFWLPARAKAQEAEQHDNLTFLRKRMNEWSRR